LKQEARILVLAPLGRDGPLAQKALEEAGLQAELCASMDALCARLAEGAGAALLTEEALEETGASRLSAALEQQPPWSDFPIVLFAGSRLPEMGTLGNVTVLERPVRMRSLLSAMRSALRARRRQYQARAMLDELGQSVRERDQFLAMLGHELRNPLAAILTAGELMERSSSPEFIRPRQVMLRQARHLARLVDDLLDVARVTSGKIALREAPLDLALLVARAVQACEPRARQQSLALSTSLPPEKVSVLGDPLRLDQVLGNLIGNALKYTPAGGAVQVVLSLEGKEAVLRVRDSGIGIAPETLPRIFELFTQAEGALDRAQGGMGIGLTLVKRLVELHGGTVAATSKGAQLGTELTVRLPLLQSAHEAAETAPRAAEPARRRILLVEDNPDTREVLQIALEESGHEVAVAADGDEAVRLATGGRPEVMLVDIGLPGKDGYDVAREVRRSLGARPLLIALTGYGQPEDRARAMAAGFDLHLTKPIDLAALEHALDFKRSA
jgi:signal transduction histidine kinase/CheY-like chemotaxis protein